ncbi:hypothetical protein HQN89_32830 [Paenibacillus frigoriresistens]|nr:hypothetical protein [Paenibacillus frigoriresistens]
MPGAKHSDQHLPRCKSIDPGAFLIQNDKENLYDQQIGCGAKIKMDSKYPTNFELTMPLYQIF